MFFYLFLIFQLFYSISCSISCYQAPFDENTFNYTITPDHFPEQLFNYTLVTNSTSCQSIILWQHGPDRTKIALLAETDIQTISTDHELQVNVGYYREDTIPIWGKQIIYQCNTDQCNSLNQLKQLLNSLKINESLYQLSYLLNPIKPFHSDWCYHGSNSSIQQLCNTSIPVNLCKKCELFGKMNQTHINSCSTCSTDDSDNSLLTYQKTFNITSRTDSTMWAILCSQPNCNTPTIDENIRQNCSISFEYTKFLNKT